MPLIGPPEKEPEPGEPTEPKVMANEGVNWVPEQFTEAEANERGPVPNCQQTGTTRRRAARSGHREPLGPKAIRLQSRKVTEIQGRELQG